MTKKIIKKEKTQKKFKGDVPDIIKYLYLGGKEKKFKTEEEFSEAVTGYFTSILDDDGETFKRPPTVTGLAEAIGLDRKQLINYGKDERFAHIIKKGRNIIERYAEERLYTSPNVAGVIFALKSYGWNEPKTNDSETVDNLIQAYIRLNDERVAGLASSKKEVKIIEGSVEADVMDILKNSK